MRIHMYGILWNERPLLPYFFRHYDPFIERYTLYDNGSNDGTLEFLARHPRVETRPFARQGGSICETARALKSQAWKESRSGADLVLVCDIDEFLWHHDVHRFLRHTRTEGITLYQPRGWEMVASTFPTIDGPITGEVQHGYRSVDFDKPCLFDPNAIEEIDYAVGCHTANPRGRVAMCCDEGLRLLHFKKLGVPYVLARSRALSERLGPRDRRQRWGHQYDRSEAEIRRDIEQTPLTRLFPPS